MAKIKKSIYFCQNCGHEESKWLGAVPNVQRVEYICGGKG